jgi:alpha-D-ribose 1-methylphosphonate 5-triphosphate synthase subunit PhnH
MSALSDMSALVDVSALEPGFADPTFGSQSAFRCILDALAYAGRTRSIEAAPEAPRPLVPAIAAMCLTLCDFETPIWLDPAAASPQALAFLKFHCGAPIVADPGGARFAVIADAPAMPRLAAFHFGEDKYPDRSATLLLQVASLTDGPARRWSGPGIRGGIDRAIAGLPEWFWDDWRLNRGLYPMGLDVIFACGRDIVGLPRGIKVEG